MSEESIIEAVKEAIKILADVRDNIGEFDRNCPALLRVAKYSALIMNVECQCDDYNGFDCECSRRSRIISDTEEEIKLRKKMT